MQMHDMMAPKVNFGISFILSSKVSNPSEIEIQNRQTSLYLKLNFIFPNLENFGM
jgi:hypothetical protein